MLFRDRIVIYCENYTKNIITLCDKMHCYWMLNGTLES